MDGGHVSNWYPKHRTGPRRSPGDREIVGRRQRISKGMSWRDVQPEWCMMGLLAPTCTALALTVRHASPRQERYASCVKLSPDSTVAEGPGRPGPSLATRGTSRGDETYKEGGRRRSRRMMGGSRRAAARGGGQRGRGGAAAAAQGSSEGRGEGTVREGAAEGEDAGSGQTGGYKEGGRRRSRRVMLMVGS